MKKVFLAAVILIVLSFNAYAVDSPLRDIRNKIFMECRDIKPLMMDSSDIIVVNSMWSSGVLTVSQVDAYFYMIGILETTHDKSLTEAPLVYLTKWLKEIRNTNDLNLKSLNGITYEVAPKTKIHLEKFKGYFNELNDVVDRESMRIAMLKKSLTAGPAE